MDFTNTPERAGEQFGLVRAVHLAAVMQYFHLVARIRQRRPLLSDWTRSAWLWRRMWTAFPEALALTLMPEHLHLLVPMAADLASRLSRVCGSFSNSFRLGRGTWDPVPEPREVPDLLHLKRQVRYVHLNPSRRELTRDPLEWIWSTHRDWMNEDSFLSKRSGKFLEKWRWSRTDFHSYVSSDPTCSVVGTPAPRPPRELILPHDVSVQNVFRAVASVTRRPVEALLKKPEARDLLLGVAAELTPYSQAALARTFGLSKGAVTYSLRRAAQRKDLPELEGLVRQALLDPRFLRLGPPLDVLARLLNDPFKKPTDG